MSTVRCLISLAASKNWRIFQLDINNAFLHGHLDEEVYMKILVGVTAPPGFVCKLNKSLYGLKQASRQWFARLHSELKSQDSGDLTVVAVYVDDILITGSNEDKIAALKSHLHLTFSIKDLGVLNFFLGIEVSHTNEGYILTQKKYTKELLQDCELDISKPVVTPFPLNLKLTTEGTPYHNAELYRCYVGKLNFLTHTRPDISFAVQCLSQFMHSPTLQHIEALTHTLRYIHSTSGQGILLRATEQLTLQAFSDSDWAACPTTRRSVTGYVLLLGNSPISWKSKKQSTISKSSSEAEYRAMSQAAAEVTWIVRLLEELGVHNLKPVALHCDNQSAIHIATNPIFHERTKHIEVDCYFTRDKVLEGLLHLSYLPTHNQLADIFTKVLPGAQHRNLSTKLGMINDSPMPSLRGGGCWYSAQLSNTASNMITTTANKQGCNNHFF
ncbi:uncharacterized mitochondrial protein AtMg00810-like [Spinacia oleracea]|uniref:Uncharacterized mitochondrial protein AtMg00810-like n=1 Tax=Spinacia oleracea TaxID=3562 RepID=A0A9R0JK18_SPIOL|nr:uncharacterized mitochondrial protein AtMg00810-like [Spinacia oleracea]XP_056692136.1 uncharacterized mitochondrial protein AtMg00810-like [Spinacia oleracea]